MPKRARFRLFCRRRCPADVQLALCDEGIFEAALEEAEQEYQRCCAGKFQEWVEWLSEHADEIIAIIQKVIKLFT